MEKVYIFYLFHLSNSKIVSIHKNKKCAYKAMINHINELFLYERKEWLEFGKGHYREKFREFKKQYPNYYKRPEKFRGLKRYSWKIEEYNIYE